MFLIRFLIQLRKCRERDGFAADVYRTEIFLSDFLACTDDLDIQCVSFLINIDHYFRRDFERARNNPRPKGNVESIHFSVIGNLHTEILRFLRRFRNPVHCYDDNRVHCSYNYNLQVLPAELLEQFDACMIPGLREVGMRDGFQYQIHRQLALMDLELGMVAENNFHTTSSLFHPRNAADLGGVGGGAHCLVWRLS